MMRLSSKRFHTSKNVKPEASDVENYGKTLALNVTKKLMQSRHDYDGLCFSHRYDCGVGLFFYGEKFKLSWVDDGYPNKTLFEFDSADAFIEWLSHENDESMACYGTQTITKVRLEWFLDDCYSNDQNEYAAYLRKREHSLLLEEGTSSSKGEVSESEDNKKSNIGQYVTLSVVCLCWLVILVSFIRA